jgi:hypothetical protein
MSDGPSADDNALPPLDMRHLVRTAAAVVIGRAQLAQRQRRRGDDPAKLDGHMAAIEAVMRALIAAVDAPDDRQ